MREKEGLALTNKRILCIGETIPVNVSIQHIYPFSRLGGLTISLCRAALFVNGNK